MKTQPEVAWYTIDSHTGYLQTVHSAGSAPSPVSPLHLPIWLVMVGGTHQQFGTHQSPHLVPKVSSKPGVSV